MANTTSHSSQGVALITGAGRGIGAAIALQLAQDGFDIAVNDLDATSARDVARRVQALGRRAHVALGDVSQYATAGSVVADVTSALGPVECLVNNAGITRDAMLLKLTEEKWDEVIRVNLKGPFNMGQACARSMSERKRGSIITLSSIAWVGNIGQTNYSASKAGVVGMTRTWALELARYGIRANAIAPGFIDTVLTQQIPAEIREKLIARVPLKRIGQPEDIARAVSFLAGASGAYITGQVLHVDGGLTTGVSF